MAAQPKPTLMQRLVAEAVGTLLLVFIGAGTGTAVGILNKLVAAENNGIKAIADAPNMGNLLIIALAHGLALLIAVYTIGKISGAHVNPAVTIGLASVGKIAWMDAIWYIVAQAVGAILGALAIVAIFGHSQAIPAGLGATYYTSASPYAHWQALAAEAGGAFILVFAIMGVIVDKRAPEGWAGLVIGFALAAAIMVCGTVSGASVNPARTLGPDLVLVMFKGVNHFGQYWVYVVGPVAGGIVAALFYNFLARPDDVVIKTERPATPAKGSGQVGAKVPAKSGRR
jgi:glycerol uptake facilitator protein